MYNISAKNKKGFTLVELIIVIVIIGVILIIGIPNLLDYMKMTRMEQLNNYARTVFLSAQNYFTTYTGDGHSLEDAPFKTDANKVDMGAVVPAPSNPDEVAENWENIYWIKVDKGDPSRAGTELYKMLSNYITDVDLLDKSILIEYNVATGIMRSAFVSDSDTISWAEVGDRTAGYLREKEIGYYGVDYSGSKPGTGDFENPDVMLVNGDRLLYAECYVDENQLDYDYVLDIYDIENTLAGSLTFRPSALDPTAVTAARALKLQADRQSEYAVYEDTVSGREGMKKYIVILDSFSEYNSFDDANEAHDLSIFKKFPKVKAGLIYVSLKATEEGEQVGESKESTYKHSYFAEDPETGGTTNGQYFIRDARHLNNIRYIQGMNGVTFTQIFNDKDRYGGGGDIVAKTFDNKDITIEPIGYRSPGGQQFAAFTGTYDARNATPEKYDGENYGITSLSISSDTQNSLGLFTQVSAGSTVKNLDIQGAVSTGSRSVTTARLGLVAGENRGAISNCNILQQESGSVGDGVPSAVTVNGVTQNNCFAGGITGRNASGGTIDSCSVEADVSSDGTSQSNIYIGGIAGDNAGRITGSTSKSNVFVTGVSHSNLFLGGMTGQNGNAASVGNDIVINTCSAAGEIYTQSSANLSNSVLGGIAGANYGVINNSHSGEIPPPDVQDEQGYLMYSIANPSHITINSPNGGANTSTGGIAGQNYSAISNCVNIARVENPVAGSSSGGIVGVNEDYVTAPQITAGISQCYNAGSVYATGSGGSVGGIAGINGKSGNTSIQYCYNTGRVNLTYDAVIEDPNGLMADAVRPLQMVLSVASPDRTNLPEA